MSIALITPYQGLQFDRILQIVNVDGTHAINSFTENSDLAAQVWEGQNQATIFSPSVMWFTNNGSQTGYTEGQVALSIAGPLTLPLDPSGEYFLLITATTGGLTSPVIETRLKVLATPGSTPPAPPDLATYDYIESSLTALQLTDGQRDFLPYLIAANSGAIRRFCGDRNFNLRTYAQFFPVALDGRVRLKQIPVNQVLRVQSQPQIALTVANSSTSVQNAQVYFTYTGEAGGYGSNEQAPTGINLVSVSNGVATTVPILFASNMTIRDLANLINVVGNGWVAIDDSTYGLWPVTELTGGYVGQGAGMSASTSGEASFHVLLDLMDCRLDQSTGMLWVGRQANGWAAQWGPGGESMFGDSAKVTGNVKVTYSAGFTTIPPQIQLALAEMCKDDLIRQRINPYLQSERAGEYAYTLAGQKQWESMSPIVQQRIAPYRLHYV